MKRLRKQQLLEQSIYAAIWGVIILLPLIGGYFAASGGLEKQEVRSVIYDSWLSIFPFFVPFLLFKKRYWQYVVSLLSAIIFVFFDFTVFCKSFP